MSQERSNLHQTIWKIADELRGSVDGWDFKQYVLGILFYKFISENLTTYLDKIERKRDKNFDYTKLSDTKAKNGRQATIKEKGFYILPSHLFCNVLEKAKADTDNLNEMLSKAFKTIEGSAIGFESEDDLKGLFDEIDVNSKKLGKTVKDRNKKLLKILEAINDLPLNADHKDNSIDTFGDAYEYLMAMYASNAGKSGGEYFTPQEVSELLAKITLVDKKEMNKVYDPACGSGSLLLKFVKILGKGKVRKGFFGQEINHTTYNLCRINMFLHNINYEKFDIAHGDTLTNPMHEDDEPFDAIVSNPPYSLKWEGDSNPVLINDPRFSPAGILAPKSKADLAFVMHILSWLSTKGTAAIVSFPGVLYRTGAEQKIRKYLIEQNFIDTVISLPSNLFFGTSIATAILVLKKSKADNKVLFIDASEEFTSGRNNNVLSLDNREKILDAFKSRKNIKHFSKLVTNKTISEMDFRLDVSSYIDKKVINKNINITHLNKEIRQIVIKQQKLRASIDKIVSELEGN